MKFANQFTLVAMPTAIGRASWRKSSETISHGMLPIHTHTGGRLIYIHKAVGKFVTIVRVVSVNANIKPCCILLHRAYCFVK